MGNGRMESLEIRKAKLEGKVEGIESILKFMHLQPFGALMNDDFLLVESFANSALDTAKLELESIQKLTGSQEMREFIFKVTFALNGEKKTELVRSSSFSSAQDLVINENKGAAIICCYMV